MANIAYHSFQEYNGSWSGWKTWGGSTTHMYVAPESNTTYRNLIRINVTNLEDGEIINSVKCKLNLMLTKGYTGSANVTFIAYLRKNNLESGSSTPTTINDNYKNTALSKVSVSMSAKGITSSGKDITVTFNNTNITSNGYYYIQVFISAMYPSGSPMELYCKANSNVTTPTISISNISSLNVNIWNGSAWKTATPYVWNGSAWKMCRAYIWNGSAWKT